MHGTDPPEFVTPAPKRIPEAYLRAEVAAFPLTSEEGFDSVLLALDPRLLPNSATSALWRACERMFAQHTGWPLDRLVAARDLNWFQPESRRSPISLARYLRALARTHLTCRAGVAAIEQGTELSVLDVANHYRWLTFTIPEDLLFAALGADPAPVRVDLDPPLLVRRLLDQGVAEIHQHMGAGMDFQLLWVSALAGLANPYVGKHELASPEAPFDNGRGLVRWMLAAAIARCALAEFLIRGGCDDFASFATGYGDPRSRGPSFSGNRLTGSWTAGRRDTLFQTLRALSVGDHSGLPEIEPLRDLYADIHPTALTLNDEPISSVMDAYQRCDPIAVRLGLRGINAGERWFLRQGLGFLSLKEQQPAVKRDPRDLFERLFWQTVRVRCQYYHAVVERPLTGGLQWFLRFYDRLGVLRHPIDPIRPEASYHVAGQGVADQGVAGESQRIRSLELRTSVGKTPVVIAEQLLDLLKSWRRVLNDTPKSGFEPEFGVLYHFVKWRDDQDAWKQGIPEAFWADTLADPYKLADPDQRGGRRYNGKDVEHGRYVRYFANQAGKTRALAELIEAVPSCLWVLRGLDVASDEIAVPTWVLAPLFRYLVDLSAKVSILPNAGPPLRITAHVGEDFRHLMEGLRRIYEQIHYVLDVDSGRLGHAIALGVEPRTWAESVGSILMPVEERLWDLVWEWRLYTRHRIRPEFGAVAPRGRVDCLLDQVRELQGRIYGGRRLAIEDLADVHHLLHRFMVRPYVATPDISGGPNAFMQAAREIPRNSAYEHICSPRAVSRFIEHYLDNERIFRNGQELVDVPIREDEVEALIAVQNALRQGISQRGIVVEVNPSSNLLIGDLLDLRNHPILRLSPPSPEPDGPPPVAIAVGSDDPVTFSTKLMHEYTLLHQAARSAGYPERVVEHWLETIRGTGMDARFTVAWAPRAQHKVGCLIDDLSRYLHEPGSRRGVHCSPNEGRR